MLALLLIGWITLQDATSSCIFDGQSPCPIWSRHPHLVSFGRSKRRETEREREEREKEGWREGGRENQHPKQLRDGTADGKY